MEFRGERKLLPALFDMMRKDGVRMFTLGIPCLLLGAMLTTKTMQRMLEIDYDIAEEDYMQMREETKLQEEGILVESKVPSLADLMKEFATKETELYMKA